MYTSDKNIIHLINLLIFQEKISSTKKFCQDVAILEQTISKIKIGKNHFTVLQIERICKKYNVNSNWIFGIQKNIFNTPEPKQIKELT